MSKFDLKDKVTVITGAAGGIGTFLSREFLSAGAKVVLASRDLDKLNALATELNSKNTLVVEMDIIDPASVEAMVKKVTEHFGRIDTLINNAGGGAMPKLPEEIPFEEWKRMIDVNLTGAFNCCIAVGKQMIKQASGKIINVSSTAGTKGNPGMLHYSAAKAGLISMTNNLAYSWAQHNICINAIAPGLIATPAMIKWGVIPPSVDEEGNEVPRLSLPPGPIDVANMCRFLASEASDMITGEIIPIRAWNPSERFWT